MKICYKVILWKIHIIGNKSSFAYYCSFQWRGPDLSMSLKFSLYKLSLWNCNLSSSKFFSFFLLFVYSVVNKFFFFFFGNMGRSALNNAFFKFFLYFCWFCWSAESYIVIGKLRECGKVDQYWVSTLSVTCQQLNRFINTLSTGKLEYFCYDMIVFGRSLPYEGDFSILNQLVDPIRSFKWLFDCLVW